MLELEIERVWRTKALNNEDWQRCIIISCDSFRKDNVWHVYATPAALGGDIIFVKGCNAELFELPVGASYEDRGARNDNHDAFGVELVVAIDSASQPVNKRKHVPEDPVVPEASVVQKRSAGQASSSNEHGSSTQLTIQAVRKTTTCPPLTWKPVAVTLNNEGCSSSSSGSAAQPAKAAPPVVLKAPECPDVHRIPSCVKPVKDASPKAAPPVLKAPKAAPPALKAAAPVVKAHLKARGSKTAAQRTPQEIETHCREDRPTAPSSPTEMELATDEEPTDDAALPSSPREPTDDAALPSSPRGLPLVLTSRAESELLGTMPTDRDPVVLMSRADSVWSALSEWWSNRENSNVIFKEQDQLRRLLFKTKKYPVPEDFWIPGAAPEGETQFVEAVVSSEWVLQQLKEVLVKREAWLTKEKLPMNFVMRNGEGRERDRFVQDCKLEYHAEPHQVEQQARDLPQGKSKVRAGKNSRWGAELQRRLGSKNLWELVSFTGEFSVDFLTRVADAGALQPVVNVTNPSPKLKAHAYKCRGDLRLASSLASQRQNGRTRFSDRELTLLLDLDSDKLRQQSNAATKAHGHGRIKHADGSFTDIGAEAGGLTRTFLDNWVAPVLPDADEDLVLSAADDAEYEMVPPNVLSEADDDEVVPESRVPSPSSESSDEFEVRAVVARARQCANIK